MKSTLFAVFAFAVSGVCYAGAEVPSPFIGEEPESQAVQNFYQARCNENAAALEEGQRHEYLSNCQQNMSGVWPIGYDTQSDSSE